MPRRRLGVVLLVPPPVSHEVDGLRRALGDPALAKVPPHLTLIPPVNVREEDLDAALAVLRAAAASTGPLTISLGPLDTFMPVTPVVYLAVAGPGLPVVHALQQRLHDGPLARSLTHDFVPHVTVADELEPDRIPAALATLGQYRHTIVRVGWLHLMEERRDEEGARVWRPLAGVAFGPPAVVGRGGLELRVEVHDRVPPDGRPLAGDREADLVVVGRRHDGPVGLLGGRVRGAKAWLEWLEVAPAAEGQGVGTHLVAAFESLAADRGAERVYARAEPGARQESFLAGRGWAREDPPPMVHGRIGPVG